MLLTMLRHSKTVVAFCLWVFKAPKIAGQLCLQDTLQSKTSRCNKRCTISNKTAAQFCRQALKVAKTSIQFSLLGLKLQF